MACLQVGWLEWKFFFAMLFIDVDALQQLCMGAPISAVLIHLHFSVTAKYCLLHPPPLELCVCVFFFQSFKLGLFCMFVYFVHLVNYFM